MQLSWHCLWLRWSKSCVLVGHTIFLARDCPLWSCARKKKWVERTDMFHGGGAKSDVYNVCPFCNFWELHVGWSRLTWRVLSWQKVDSWRSTSLMCLLLSFFQDVSDPEYAQVQEALKNNLKISVKPRKTIYAVAVVEEPSDSDKKSKPHAKVTAKASLRLAHSAEDVSTLERQSRRGECVSSICSCLKVLRFISLFEYRFMLINLLITFKCLPSNLLISRRSMKFSNNSGHPFIKTTPSFRRRCRYMLFSVRALTGLKYICGFF